MCHQNADIGRIHSTYSRRLSKRLGPDALKFERTLLSQPPECEEIEAVRNPDPIQILELLDHPLLAIQVSPVSRLIDDFVLNSHRLALKFGADE